MAEASGSGAADEPLRRYFVANLRRRKANAVPSLLNFVNRVDGPAIMPLNKENVTDFSSSDDLVFIAYLRDDDNTGLLGRFATLATRYTDQFTFGAVNVPKGDNKLECYNNLDGSTHVAPDITRSKAMDELVTACRHSNAPPLTLLNQPRVELVSCLRQFSFGPPS